MWGAVSRVLESRDPRKQAGWPQWWQVSGQLTGELKGAQLSWEILAEEALLNGAV